jgi:hypothetical protein
MKIWVDLFKEKRLRIWLNKPYIHRTYHENGIYIVFGLEKNNDDFYGITLFDYTLTIYFKCRIDLKRLVTWQGTELNPIGVNLKE